MTEKQLKMILWIASTMLFFVVFCGMSYLISHSIVWAMTIVFFVVLGVLDKKGISYLVAHYIAKSKETSEDASGRTDTTR